MEHAQLGDFFDFTLKLKLPMGEPLARFLFKQIISCSSFRTVLITGVLITGHFSGYRNIKLIKTVF